MTTDRPQDSKALPAGLAAVPTYTQLGRDVIALWVGASEQIVRLSVETNESAIEAVRTRLGRWAVPPAAELWNWWASTAAGLLGAYQETLQQFPAAPASTAARETDDATNEVDLTEPPTADVPTRRTAAAERSAPKTTASTTRRSRAGN